MLLLFFKGFSLLGELAKQRLCFCGVLFRLGNSSCESGTRDGMALSDQVGILATGTCVVNE